MTDSMVERVARASRLCRVEGTIGMLKKKGLCLSGDAEVRTVLEAGIADFYAANPNIHAADLQMAKAIIAAMREPTGAMLDCGKRAGWSGVIEGDEKLEREAAGYLWGAMIDIALKDPA